MVKSLFDSESSVEKRTLSAEIVGGFWTINATKIDIIPIERNVLCQIDLK